jgi:hypothetical protein
VDDCGPATPGSPFELPGLAFSDFARHYFRNHGCFLLLGVLRWFTSPGSLVHPMDSDERNQCSHWLGFPIRKSPDHSLLAASRGLSQLIASFIAYLRQGIHTHALSSLTIKSTTHTWQNICQRNRYLPRTRARGYPVPVNATFYLRLHTTCKTCVLYARQIFSCQRSRLRQQPAGPLKPCGLLIRTGQVVVPAPRDYK